MHKLLTKKVNIVLSLMLAFTLILVGCTANETKKVETEKAGQKVLKQMGQ